MVLTLIQVGEVLILLGDGCPGFHNGAVLGFILMAQADVYGPP